jgi:hypothetical protein
MAFPPVPSRLRCPNCEASFVVQVRTIIDVGQEPELKEQFLRGEINRAQCPQCGAGGMLSAPLVYHDPEKEILVSYMPAELGLSTEEQERTVGSLVNAIMNGVPAEERKGYFLQPKTVLTYNGLLELILEAEGYSKEMLQQQRQWLTVIHELLEAMDDDTAFVNLVDEHRDTLTYEFYLLLSELAEAEGEQVGEEGENALADLRTKLLEHAAPELPQSAPGAATAGELIDRLLEIESDEEWERAASQALPFLDYGFFQTLTERLEQAQESDDTEAAEKLGRLRQRLLDMLDRQSQRYREAEDKASLLIMDMLEAEDLDAAVHEHADELDEVFFMVLARLQQTAVQRNNTRRAERLLSLLDAARGVREEALPPDLRLISRLLRAQYPDESNRVLEEHRGLLNDELLELYDRYVKQVSEGADEAVQERLSQIRQQIVAKLTILRA